MLDRTRDLHAETLLPDEFVDAGDPDFGGFECQPVGWFLTVNLDDSEHADANSVRDLLTQQCPRGWRVRLRLWRWMARSLKRNLKGFDGGGVLISLGCS